MPTKTTSTEGDEGKTDISYDDVDLNLTAGYKPTLGTCLIIGFLLAAAYVIGLFVSFETMTWVYVLDVILITIVGFIFEYWITQRETDTPQTGSGVE